MSSIKNRYYKTCETLALGFRSLGEGSKSWSEEIKKEDTNMKIEKAEELCLACAMRHPDGNPLRGKDAVSAGELLQKVIVDGDYELFNRLKEAGFIHK
jgi:hypothetical protein